MFEFLYNEKHKDDIPSLNDTVFENVDTVWFDLDATLWGCFKPDGEGIGAYEMSPPFELIYPNVVVDADDNICRLQNGVKKFLDILDQNNIDMGVVSRGQKRNTPFGAQPSTMLLKKFDIYHYFNLDIILKENIDKSDYVKPQGNTIFFDDDDENVKTILRRYGKNIRAISRGDFDDWLDLIEPNVALSNLKFSYVDPDTLWMGGASGYPFLYNHHTGELMVGDRGKTHIDVAQDHGVDFAGISPDNWFRVDDGRHYVGRVGDDKTSVAFWVPDNITRDQKLINNVFALVESGILDKDGAVYFVNHYPGITIKELFRLT